MSKTVADVMYVSPQTAAERGNGDRGSGSHFRSTLPLARMESADSRDMIVGVAFHSRLALL